MKMANNLSLCQKASGEWHFGSGTTDVCLDVWHMTNPKVDIICKHYCCLLLDKICFGHLLQPILAILIHNLLIFLNIGLLHTNDIMYQNLPYLSLCIGIRYLTEYCFNLDVGL